jgi:3-deoxy-D-manno-octulosonate 8-phosphate phosphatase KdsC-like HAD superfamily phosphatase
VTRRRGGEGAVAEAIARLMADKLLAVGY